MWVVYAVAAWPVIGLIVVLGVCRLIHKSKIRRGEVFEA